ncbi:MAG: polysaccharide pyruvyl transferase family protein [Prevotellaceae bacterium]|nr:polysaccharide pyruvyl transferase family protein [Prevotellaceae bacterium]
MKIAIITLAPRKNYGNTLQAFALQTVLERMGHEAFILDSKKQHSHPWRIPLLYCKRFLDYYILHKPKAPRVLWEREQSVIRQHFNSFMDRHLHFRYIRTTDSLKPSDFEAYVVGSDQVWRPRYAKAIINKKKIAPFYLDFAEHWRVKRVAYAVSFGTDAWEYSPEETSRCAQLAKLFDAVSVREASAAELCRKYLGVQATHLLDPTMLLTADDYDALWKANGTPPAEGSLFYYILDESEEKMALVRRIAEETGTRPFSVNMSYYSRTVPASERKYSPPEQWLRSFHDASFVVTDSFHGCVFSILYGKQFVVYGNEKRGMSRFHSLLALFGIEDRLVYSLSQYSPLPPIDYSQVRQRLAQMRQLSMNFLRESLS